MLSAPTKEMAAQSLKARSNSGLNWLINGLNIRSTLSEAAANTNKMGLERLLKQTDKPSFDVVIVYTSMPNEAGIYLAHRMGAKLVLYCSAHGPNIYAQWAVGQPFNPAYQSSNGYISSRLFSFRERILNIFCVYYIHATYRQVIHINNMHSRIHNSLACPDIGQNDPDDPDQITDQELNFRPVLRTDHH